MSMQLSLTQIAAVIGCPNPSQDVMVTGAVIDSRKVTDGCLFIALAGEHADGHHYVPAARQAGASAALVSSLQEDDVLPQLVVADVIQAFGKLTKYWRQQCTTKVVAITGSNGKTTVKEMVAAIIAWHGSVLATKGNLNNKLGVPLTLSLLDKNTDYAVIEMGASKQGDIAYLVDLVQPQIALINNVATAHLAGFGDINGVATAKAEIYEGLSQDGVGIINDDMAFALDWKTILAGKQYVTFSISDETADISAGDIQLNVVSSDFMVELKGILHHISLPLPGIHNVANALAAIAISHALGIPEKAIVGGLASVQRPPHRLQVCAAVNGAQIIDDSYNANPCSYEQALIILSNFSGEHWLVLGDFAELGKDSERIHYQMGVDAKKSGVVRLLAIGDHTRYSCDAFGLGAQHFNNMNVLQQQLKQDLARGITCLIKGSHCMQLDKLADMLTVTGEC